MTMILRSVHFLARVLRRPIQYAGGHSPILYFVEDDSRIPSKIGVVHCFVEKHVVRHVLKKGCPGLVCVVEPNGISDLLS